MNSKKTDQDETEKDENQQTVCFCHNVSRAKITEAILNGADSVEKIQQVTLASTGCGGCLMEVEEILSFLSNHRKKAQG